MKRYLNYSVVIITTFFTIIFYLLYYIYFMNEILELYYTNLTLEPDNISLPLDNNIQPTDNKTFIILCTIIGFTLCYLLYIGYIDYTNYISLIESFKNDNKLLLDLLDLQDGMIENLSKQIDNNSNDRQELLNGLTNIIDDIIKNNNDI